MFVTQNQQLKHAIPNALLCNVFNHWTCFPFAVWHVGYTRYQFKHKYLQWYYISFVEPWENVKSHSPNNQGITIRVVRQFGTSHAQWIIHQNEFKCRLLREFWIHNFRQRLERVIVGSIVNMKNECLFSWFMGEWIVARNKQIAREPLLDIFPVNPEKDTNSLNTSNCPFVLTCHEELSKLNKFYI